MNHPVLRTAVAVMLAAACPMASACAGFTIQAIDLRNGFAPEDVTVTPKTIGAT